MPRPERHNEIELNLVRRGWVTYFLGGRKVRIEAGRLSAFWAAIPHQVIDCGNETEYFVATIPLAWFLQFKLPDKLVQPLLHGAVISEPNGGLAPTDYQFFAQWETDLRTGENERQRLVRFEMKARLHRLALLLPAVRARSPQVRGQKLELNEGSSNKVEQMACLIARLYTEKLSIEMIGHSVKLHPSYAMSLFQRTFGTTLVDYLTSHRVSHAQRLLATTNEKVVEVAYCSGFNTISRFNDAFKRACGCSPRDYRKFHLLDEVSRDTYHLAG